MGQLQRAGQVAAVDLRRRLRNRSALVTPLLGPLALAVVFSLLVGGDDDVRLTIGVVDQDGSAAAARIVDGLRGRLTAHAWAIDAWETLVFDLGGVADIATNLLVLVAFAAGLLGVATVVLRRRLLRA